MAENWDVIIDNTGYGGRKIYYNKLNGQTTFEKPNHLKTEAELKRDLYLQNSANSHGIDPLDFSDMMIPSASSTDHAIDSRNVGFQMLQKYGWNEAKGLGKDEKGIVAPVQLQSTDILSSAVVDDIDDAVADVTRERRKLDIEIEQTSDMLARKAENAEREQQIEKELKEIHREFYCEWCDKQYKNVAEMSSHLSSYDHHHTKRLKEMKQNEKKRALASAGNEDDIRRKEEKRALRDLEKRAKQMSEQLNQNNSSTSGPPSDEKVSPPVTNSPMESSGNAIEGSLPPSETHTLPLERDPSKIVKFGLKMNIKKK